MYQGGQYRLTAYFPEQVIVRYIITGAGGLLGSELSNSMVRRGMEYKALLRTDLDVTNGYAVEHLFKMESPDVVFHCAAFTAVDKAESENASSSAVNASGALNVAEACKIVGARMVLFSTDYVFGGSKRTPYSPQDHPDPLSAYGKSKLAGEKNVSASGVSLLLIRTSWLYGSVGRNFVSAVIQHAREGKTLRLVGDQTGSPTWARHVAEATLDLVECGVTGTYHISNAGEATWYEFGREVLLICGLQTEVEQISTEMWGASAHRPYYSVLDSSKAEAVLDRRMPPWRDSLKIFLQEILE